MLEEFNLEIFSVEVDKLIAKDISYPDAVCRWCELHNVELEIVAAHIKKNPILKAKMLESAKKLRMIRE